MLTDNDLKELLARPAGSTVLSVYLNTDPAEGNADTYKLRLRSMLKEVEMPEDMQAVIRYFDHEHNWSGRSVAVFSCAAEGFLRAYTIGVPIRSRVRTGDRPFVKPLANLLDSYGGYGVLLVDQQGARLFFFNLGELMEQEGMMGESVRRTKRGGGSQSPGRRGGTAGQTDYVDEVTDRNMKEAVDFAVHFFKEKNVRRVVIGGTEENAAQFRSQLPKAWQSLVVGSFPVSMTASQNEILERAMELGRKAEERREAHLAEMITTAAAKGRGGAINLTDTLNAVREGRVQTLLVRDGYRAPGYRCTGCGYLSAEELKVCPFCGGTFETIPDAVELAVRQVMQAGGEVEVLPTGRLTGQFENIGALLRY